MQCAEDVCVVVKPRVLDRGPNTSARRQVYDHIYFLAAKHHSHRIVLAQVDVANGYVFCEISNVRVLDPRIVKIIEIVEDHDFMPNSQQLLYKMRPDKTGAACDQNSHKTRT